MARTKKRTVKQFLFYHFMKNMKDAEHTTTSLKKAPASVSSQVLTRSTTVSQMLLTFYFTKSSHFRTETELISSTLTVLISTSRSFSTACISKVFSQHRTMIIFRFRFISTHSKYSMSSPIECNTIHSRKMAKNPSVHLYVLIHTSWKRSTELCIPS